MREEVIRVAGARAGESDADLDLRRYFLQEAGVVPGVKLRQLLSSGQPQPEELQHMAIGRLLPRLVCTADLMVSMQYKYMLIDSSIGCYITSAALAMCKGFADRQTCYREWRATSPN